MNNNRYAIIDIGTNTFHLLVVDVTDNDFEIVRKSREGVRLGLGGINKKIITDDAQERAIKALSSFKEIGVELEVADFYVYATSAVRNASNRESFLKEVFVKTGISINVIDGEREAELIYKGVSLEEGMLNEVPSLIVDIGGGSVEFIIANSKKRFWTESFEIGGLRLYNMFHSCEPIGLKEFKNLNQYIESKLTLLKENVEKYGPKVMIGCSGTFDTLLDIQRCNGFFAQTSFSKPFFDSVYQELVLKNREERLLIEGMIPLRVDLIVVSCCIIDYLFKIMQLEESKVSRNALKEGVVYEILENRIKS